MRALAFALVLLVSASAVAQSGIDYIGTYILTGEMPLSADAASAAQAGSFTPTDEPLAFHRNPALLAGVGRAGGVAASFDGSSDFGFTSGDALHGALAAGKAVTVAGQPLAVGIALSRTSINFGSQILTDDTGHELGTFTTSEATWSAALGAGWSGPVDVDLGVGLHRRRSMPFFFTSDLTESERATGVTLDLGTAITLPVFGRTPSRAYAPILDLSTGYAQRHITVAISEPEFLAVRESPSTSRVGVLGFGARAGLDMALGTGRVRALVLDGRVEGNANLDRYVSTEIDETGFPLNTELVRDALIGDLDANHIFLGDGNYSVAGRRALRLTLFDALSYTHGHLEGNGYYEGVSTWGLGLDMGAALRAYGLASGDARLARTGERLSVRASYSVSSIREDTVYSFGGLTLGWRP